MSVFKAFAHYRFAHSLVYKHDTRRQHLRLPQGKPIPIQHHSAVCKSQSPLISPISGEMDRKVRKAIC